MRRETSTLMNMHKKRKEAQSTTVRRGLRKRQPPSPDLTDSTEVVEGDSTNKEEAEVATQEETMRTDTTTRREERDSP